MPKIIVVGQKFLSKYNNGDDFTTNDTTDFAVHLKGGVLEEMKAVFNVQVSWDVAIKQYKYIYDNSANTLSIEEESVDWVGEGFSIGDLVKYSINSVQMLPQRNQITGIVTAISGGEIRLGSVAETQGALSNGTFYIDGDDDYITGITPKTALKYDFGIIENDEPINFLSKLTNTDQTYFYKDIDHGVPLTFSDGVTQGNNKAGYTGSSKVAFVGLVADNDRVYPSLTTQEFQIEHIFKINPFYRDGEIDSLDDSDVPPLDIFNGSKSLKYVFQSEFRTVLNNPNTSMISEYDTQLGSVGYLDESFNGYASDFSVSDLVYTNIDTGLVVDKLNVGAKVRAEFNLNSTDGVFVTGMNLIVGHTSVQDSLTYTNSTDDYSGVWLDETKSMLVDAVAVDGTIITGVFSTLTSPSVLAVTFDIEFTTTTQRNKIELNQDYLLYYTIADPTKTVDEGSKVTGRIDVNVYDKSSDIAGLFDVDILEQYPIPYEFEKGVTTGFTQGKMFIQDEQFCYARIKVLNTYLGEEGNLLEDVTLESLRFKIVAYNTVLNTWFDIRNLEIDLTDQIVSGNVQDIVLDSNRGYVLTDVDIFNSLKLTTDTNDGTWQYYDLEIGYKIPWQNWLELTGADTIFLDRAKEQSGLNQNASNYSFTNDYVIKFLIDADVETTGVSTNYVKRTGDFLAYNTNTDDQEPDAYSCVTSTFKEDGTPILGNVIQKEFTEVRAVVTPLFPPVDVGDVDMTEVATSWNRFAHGNKFLPPATGFPRAGNWLNEQADDVDTFSDSVTDFTKNDVGLYTSTPSKIETTENCGALYGCYSLLKYEFYNITGKMFSDFPDNDALVYDIAFMTDEFGVEHKLSLGATTGGWLLDLFPGFVIGDDQTTTLGTANAVANWALIYDFGKRGCVQLDLFNTTKAGFDWNDVQVGDLAFDVTRTANEIEVIVDWTIDGVAFNNTFNYNLNDNDFTQKFIGVQNIGFSFVSQSLGGFKDVQLANPSTGYYGVLRMETKNSPSDFGMSELNTEVENTENSLLKQISGSENKAKLSFDGTDFIIQGLVKTENVEKGEDYEFSAELRRKDLEL